MAVTTRTHYEILGVPQDASAEEIKKAYRGLARKTHPDVSAGMTALFGLITEAFEVLSDEKRRAEYDRSLSGETQTGTRQAPQPDQDGYDPYTPWRQAQDAFWRMRQEYADQERDRASQASARAQQARAAAEEERRRAEQRWEPSYWLEVAQGGLKRLFSRRDVTRPHPAWWTLPLILLVTGGLALVRFTGFTADLFNVQPGTRVALGVRWDKVPSLDVPNPGTPLSSFVFLCALLFGAYWVRRIFRPVPLLEKGILLGYVAAFAFAGEFLFAEAWWIRISLWLLVGYAAWLGMLALLPKPVSGDAWVFRPWVRYLIEFDTSPVVGVLRLIGKAADSFGRGRARVWQGVRSRGAGQVRRPESR